MNSTYESPKMIATDSIDAAWLKTIVRQVVARVEAEKPKASKLEASKPFQSPETFVGKLVSLETIDSWVASRKTEIRIGKKTIVTPAAVDEAKRHGIAILRSEGCDKSLPQSASSDAGETKSAGYEITDSQDPHRAVLIGEQLRRRGATGSAMIVSSDSPAVDVFRLCSEKRRAVMIADIASVERFGNELSPDVWVLDMKKLNLIAAVNAAQKILEL